MIREAGLAALIFLMTRLLFSVVVANKRFTDLFIHQELIFLTVTVCIAAKYRERFIAVRRWRQAMRVFLADIFYAL